MAVISLLRGKLRSRISRPTGVIMAPPSPCRARIASSMPKLLAIPHSAEPRVKVNSASANTFRAPNLSANQPLTGMNTASVRM